MRKTLFLLCIVALLGVARPAEAQFRTDAPAERAPVKLYGSDAPTFTLNKLFSPDHFRMNHTYSFTAGSFGGDSYSFGVYTNTMRWQFSEKLAARVDVGFLHSPFSGLNGQEEGLNGQLFLQNAEIAYRPTENMQLHFTVQQSPFGAYARPGGYYGYSPYGYGMMSYRAEPHDLFWRGR